MMNVNLLSPRDVRVLLAERRIRPTRRLGQNFLIDRNILDKIIGSARPKEARNILEIGPGLGTVTLALSEEAEKVVAVEVDSGLAAILQEILAGRENVEVVHADFLKLSLEDFLAERFGGELCTAVSNLPYSITSPVIIRLLEHKRRFARIVLTVQREVARRLAARHGTEDYGALTVMVQYHSRLEIIANVPRTVFYPTPEVDSALIVLEPLPEPSVRTRDEELFFRVVRAALGKRRKTIWNALSGAAGEDWTKDAVRDALRSAGIDPVRRGETLSLEEFARLADEIGAAGSND